MFKLPFCAIVLIAASLTAVANPATAQSSNPEYGGRPAPGSAGADPNPVPIRSRTWGTRLGSMEPAQSRGMVIASAQAVARAAGIACRVTEATRLGTDASQKSIYEAACAAGPGYLLVDGSPPTASDCLALSGQADVALARDPNANTGTLCRLRANLEFTKVVAAYAKDADIDCTVDQGAWVGKSTAGNAIYEVGCAQRDGYWIEKTSAGWTSTPCLRIMSDSSSCRFTLPAEQAATVKMLLIGSPGDACDVTGSRYMGADADSYFYEARCGANIGFVAQVRQDGTVQSVTSCSEAALIGGGCQLTSSAEVRR